MIGEIGGNFWKNYDLWKKNWSTRIVNIVSIVLSRRTFFFSIIRKIIMRILLRVIISWLGIDLWIFMFNKKILEMIWK